MTSLQIRHKNIEVGRITKDGNLIPPGLSSDLIFFQCFCKYRFETRYDRIKEFGETISLHLNSQHTKDDIVNNTTKSLLEKLFPNLKIEELDYI